MSDPASPPLSDPDSAGFWAAIAEGDLRVRYCRTCARAYFPPIPTCPTCGGRAVEHRPAVGTGVVYSWVTIHQTLDPAFAADVPYTVLAVDLDEGGRMLGRLIGGGRLEAGAPVRFSPYRADDRLLPGFTLGNAADRVVLGNS